MKTNYNDEERYYQAHKRVEEIKGFYVHLAVYILCNPIVIVVNIMTSPEFLYFWFCLLGWGIAVALHGLTVFSFGKAWQERKIKEILEKENNKQTWE